MKIPPVKVVFSEEDRREILERIDASLSSGILTLGENTREFESLFASTIEVPHAVAVNGGSSAIEIAMRIFGVEDKTVLVPTNTFFATPASVIRAGGKVKFVDMDPDTLSIDFQQMKKLATKAAGVIVVHIAGIVTPLMPEIRKFCDDNQLFLFEDAAHAIGSMTIDGPAGSFGHAAGFSLFPTKVITSAEGGMLVTSEERIRDETKLYRDQGKRSPEENIHDKIGSNWRMSEPNAAIGIQHILRLGEFIEERNEISMFYDDVLSSIDGITPLVIPDKCFSNYYKYVAMIDDGIDRDAVKARLRDEWEISMSGGVYDTPCHKQPVFKDNANDSFPIAEDFCARHVCLPIYNGMTEEEMYCVAQGISSVLRG